MISFHNVLHGQLVNIVSNQAPLNGIDPDVNMLAHENTFIKNNKYVAIKQLDDLNKNSNSVSFVNATVRILVNISPSCKVWLFVFSPH